VIYQELHLVPEMTVAETLSWAICQPMAVGWIAPRSRRPARRQLEFVGEPIDPDTRLGDLPLAQRQMVEIAKALTRGARIIAFDEPTSSLSEREVRRLFTIIRGLRDRGCAVLYVSHRMEEIFALCDRITNSPRWPPRGNSGPPRSQSRCRGAAHGRPQAGGYLQSPTAGARPDSSRGE
jgi:L-arabinose transport system ATP-binding protein